MKLGLRSVDARRSSSASVQRPYADLNDLCQRVAHSLDGPTTGPLNSAESLGETADQDPRISLPPAQVTRDNPPLAMRPAKRPNIPGRTWSRAKQEDPAPAPRERRREPTCLQMARAPFLEMLSGHDRARVTIYDWWTR